MFYFNTSPLMGLALALPPVEIRLIPIVAMVAALTLHTVSVAHYFKCVFAAISDSDAVCKIAVSTLIKY